MALTLQSKVKLNNGVELPVLHEELHTGWDPTDAA